MHLHSQHTHVHTRTHVEDAGLWGCMGEMLTLSTAQGSPLPSQLRSRGALLPSSEHPVLVCPRRRPHRRKEGPRAWGGPGSGQQLSSPRGDGHPLFLRGVLVKGNLYCSEPGGPKLCSSLKPREEKLKPQRRFRGFPLEKQEA